MNKRISWIIIAVLVGLVAGLIIWPQLATTRPTLTPIGTTGISTENQMSAYEAEVFIDQIISNHQYYLNHPSEQSFATGDDEWQRYYIKQYNRLRKLVEVLSK